MRKKGGGGFAEHADSLNCLHECTRSGFTRHDVRGVDRQHGEKKPPKLTEQQRFKRTQQHLELPREAPFRADHTPPPAGQTGAPHHTQPRAETKQQEEKCASC